MVFGHDWLSAFVPAFYAMVHEAAQLIGVDEEELLDDLQAVHRKHGDSEHPFALLETRAVQKTVLSKSMMTSEIVGRDMAQAPFLTQSDSLRPPGSSKDN